MVPSQSRGLNISRRLPAVVEDHGDGRNNGALTVIRGGEIGDNADGLIAFSAKWSQPGSVSKDYLLERVLGGLRGKYHLPVLQVNKVGINDDSSEGQSSNQKHKTLVVSLIACVFFVVMNLYAAWQIVEDGNFWTGALLLIGGLAGIAYCFSLFV